MNPTFGTFVPALSFATPGDLSVAYTIQEGRYAKLGDLVWFAMRVAGTPTYSSAVGSLRLGPLPFAPSGSDLPERFICELITSGVTWPTGTTQMFGIVVAGSDLVGVECQGSAATRNPFSTAHCPSGSARDLILVGQYFAA